MSLPVRSSDDRRRAQPEAAAVSGADRGTSLRTKILRIAMATTFAALLVSAMALLAYEQRVYRTGWVADLKTQADLVATSSASALEFDDAKAAAENLALLKVRPQIEAAAVYRADGALFATYAVRGSVPRRWPERPGADGHRFDGDHLTLVQRVEQNGELLGTVVLTARHDLGGRLRDYFAILLVVSAASLGLAALLFSRLQHAVTRPILAVADAAREVIQRRNYALRVPKTTDDEVGTLVDAFNGMLEEVGRRAEALERSYEDLSVEMAERHKAEEALRRADRRKDEFLATLAHELRNPLAPLTNALEIQKLADADPAARQRTRAIMERQLRQMARLIDDLLEVSRITTGKLELKRETVDLIAVLRNAIELSESAVRSRGHALATDWPDGPVWVHADPIRLAQVFGNLVNNAAKYTDPGGQIRVEVELRDGAVDVRVADNGIGIDPSMQQAIFEMFMQVDQSLERGRAGLGVGLTLAKQLVELHGGTLSVFSAGLGRGSQFTVSLPLGIAPPASAHVDAAIAARAATPLDVLIADDNVDFALSLAHMLEAIGHRVRVVHDGEAAFDAARAAPPDIGIFDIGMPRLNGYDLARRLRALPQFAEVPLVAITGWGQQGDRDRALAAGFDRHLVKPVDLRQVLYALAATRGA